LARREWLSPQSVRLFHTRTSPREQGKSSVAIETVEIDDKLKSARSLPRVSESRDLARLLLARNSSATSRSLTSSLVQLRSPAARAVGVDRATSGYLRAGGGLLLTRGATVTRSCPETASHLPKTVPPVLG